MNTPYSDAEDFIRKQIQKVLEQYEEWQKETETYKRKAPR
jgi:hypothetical protein